MGDVGFGMRYALVSGRLAGDAFVDDDLPRYEGAYRRGLDRGICAFADAPAIVNGTRIADP